MIIGISTKVFDLEGSLILQDAELRSRITNMSRRVKKVATLEGGVSIEDNGFVEGDRTFNLTVPLKTESQFNQYRYLIKNYSEINISTREGMFLAALSTLRARGGQILMTIEIIEQIT